MAAPGQMKMDSIDESKVTVLSACCCCFTGFLLDASGLGCAAKETLCCLECDFCCKAGTEMLGLGCCALRCVPCTVCIKQQGQCCCLVEAIALPCDAEVPAVLAACCLVCYPKVGCCMKIGEAKS
mmetsp:Transcript_40111/g.95837  ORF Transcript_40111/g.95837 Transcript_40111/m.95837 type:complete len:125 (+) Transcript_40111:83-457(+)